MKKKRKTHFKLARAVRVLGGEVAGGGEGDVSIPKRVLTRALKQLSRLVAPRSSRVVMCLDGGRDEHFAYERGLLSKSRDTKAQCSQSVIFQRGLVTDSNQLIPRSRLREGSL